MGEKKTYRLFVDSGACQNGEGIARLTAEPAEQGNGVYADVCLSGGEDGVDAKFLCLIQRFERISAHIKGAVEGDGHAVCRIQKAFHRFQIKRAVRRQAADHHALCSGAAEGTDLSFHHGQFFRAVEEIAEARPDERVNGKIGMQADLFIEGKGRRNSADDKAGA